MHPGTLVTDICHLVQVWVQSGCPDALLEQGLMGERRTACHDHPVQVVLSYSLGNCADRVLRAGIEHVFCMDHVRQGSGICAHRGHIQEAANVRTTVADEHSYPGRLCRDIPLPGILSLASQRPACPPQQTSTGSGSAAGFYNRLGDILRFTKRADRVYSRSAGLQRVELRRVAESISVKLNTQSASQVANRSGYFHSDREHDQIKRFTAMLADFVPIFYDQIAGMGNFAQGAHPAASIFNAVPVTGTLKITPISLRKGAHLHHQDVNLQTRVVLFGNDGLFSGVHAAYGRTIVMVPIATAHTLQKSDPLRGLAVGRSMEMTHGWARSREQAL